METQILKSINMQKELKKTKTTTTTTINKQTNKKHASTDLTATLYTYHRAYPKQYLASITSLCTCAL